MYICIYTLVKFNGRIMILFLMDFVLNRFVTKFDR
jgi:hypothetical protein